MKTTLNKKQRALFDEISRILWTKWDPIGVNDHDGNDEWCDEYDGYVPHLFRLAIEGRDKVRIASSLAFTAETNIGIGSYTEKNLHVAELILQAKRDILG